VAGSFELGVVDAIIKIAQVKDVESVGGTQPKAKKVDKTAPKKATRQIGLGDETMDMGNIELGRKQPLNQPEKPQRY
jgi:hypothetical protein